MTHTPGPWKATQGSCGGEPMTWWDVDGAPETFEGSSVAFPQSVCMVMSHSNGATEGNARLIAAAPDLLMALKHWQDNTLTPLERYHETKAAIMKAEGR